MYVFPGNLVRRLYANNFPAHEHQKRYTVGRLFFGLCAFSTSDQSAPSTFSSTPALERASDKDIPSIFFSMSSTKPKYFRFSESVKCMPLSGVSMKPQHVGNILLSDSLPPSGAQSHFRCGSPTITTGTLFFCNHPTKPSPFTQSPFCW